MTSWPVKTLGEVCELVNGATPDTKVKEYWGGKHAWITPAEMGGLDSPFLSVSRRTLSDKGLASCSATMVPPKTVILSSRAPIGHLVINEVPMATNQGCKSLIPKEGLDFSFLYYYLKANVEILESLGTGTTFKELSGTQLKTVEIPVPPLEEQKRIVALLDAATARVTELCVCYEQARTHANSLFTSALSSALEDNPDWPIKTLGDISEISYGYTESAKSEAVGPKFLRITDIKDRGVNWDDVPYCPIDDAQLNRHRLGDGDIVFARTGATTGKSFLVTKPPLAVCASYLIRLRTDKKMVSPDFLNLNFQTNAYWKQVNEGMSGAAQGGFNASKLGALEIPVPPLDEQKKIVERLDLMKAKTSEMVAAYDVKLTAAKNLRQSILESAFAGDL